jgi:hypothetical protein
MTKRFWRATEVVRRRRRLHGGRLASRTSSWQRPLLPQSPAAAVAIAGVYQRHDRAAEKRAARRPHTALRWRSKKFSRSLTGGSLPTQSASEQGMPETFGQASNAPSRLQLAIVSSVRARDDDEVV